MHTHLMRDTLHSIGEDYTFRLPGYFKRTAWIGVGGLLIALVLLHVLSSTPLVGAALLVVSLLYLLPMLIAWIGLRLIYHYRLGLRDRMVGTVNWRGDEQVLDIGTGSGIALIGCARKLRTGRATGIDIWDPNAGGGTAETFWKNVRSAGVQDRVDLQNQDARQMPFADASFDVIVSSFAMHHVGGVADRQQAAREMVRVLRPGGTIAIADVASVLDAVEQVLRSSGFTDIRRSGRIANLLTAHKP